MPRYIDIEKKEQADNEFYKNRIADPSARSLEKKVNKYKPHILFDKMLEDRSILKYIYQSNGNYFWTSLDLAIKNINKSIVRIVLEKAPKLIEDKKAVNVLKAITEFYTDRVHDIESWDVKTKSSKGIVPSLINHLFAKYDVPTYLINGFYDYNLESIYFYIHIGAGKSIKSFPLIPITVPKKAYHLIQTTPNHCSFNESFVRIAVLHMGGNDRLFNTLMGSRIGTFTEKINDKVFDFWKHFIRICINNDHMLNHDKIPEIVDYVHDLKNQWRLMPNGRYGYINKDFSFKGRTINSLIRQSDEWHEIQTKNAKRLSRVNTWESLNIDWTKEFKNGRGVIIKELTSTKELVKEGTAMVHCVSSYASSCIKGACNIFSLRKVTHGIETPLVTIELRGKVVKQGREKYNERVSSGNRSFINEWVEKNGLTVSRYF